MAASPEKGYKWLFLAVLQPQGGIRREQQFHLGHNLGAGVSSAQNCRRNNVEAPRDLSMHLLLKLP